jgi:YD repeat-containing protein
MKPFGVIVLGALALAGVSYVPPGDSTLMKAGLYGKVRSVENWRADDGFRRDTRRPRRNELYHDSSRSLVIFDEYGKVIEAIYLDADSMQAQRDDYKYDLDGRLDEIDLDATNHADFPPKVEYRYNKDGQVRSIGYYFSGSNSGDPTIQYWYDYNDKGLVSTMYVGNAGSKYQVIMEYRYDAAGRLIQADNEDGDNRLKERKAYTYDTAGHLLQEIRYKGDGTSISQREDYVYNSDGKKIEELDYYADGKYIYAKEEEFPKHENKPVRIDSVRKVWEYYYNYKVVESTESEYPTGKVTSVRDSVVYVNDSIGNWIKQAHYLDNKDSTVTYRKISYY